MTHPPPELPPLDPTPSSTTSEPLGESTTDFEELGACQFTAREAALIMGLPADGFVRDVAIAVDGLESTEEATAFLRGRLSAEAAVRKKIRIMAVQGSSPAQRDFLKLVDERVDAERKQARRTKP